MADINHVVLVGRLTKNAELKYTNNGQAVSKFSIAVNSRKKKEDQWVDEAHFFDIVYWGKGAEAVTPYLLKGKQVGVEGSLRQNRWEQEGQSRSKVEINANNVMLLGGKSQGAPVESQPAGGAGGKEFPENQPHADNFEDDIPF